MPTAVTDTDDFVATVQRPNNGELADAASLQQGLEPLTKRTRHLYNRSLPGNFDAVHFGYVGSGAVDDYGAIRAAADAAIAAKGGTVWIPGGTSARLDTELVMDGRWHLKTHKGLNGSAQSRLIRNHSGRLLNVDHAIFVTDNTPTVVEGFKLEDAASSSNPMVDLNGGSLALRHCWLDGNASFTNGPLLRGRGDVTSNIWLDQCVISPDTSSNAIYLDIGALVVLAGTRLVLPATYTARFIDIQSISASDPAIVLLSGAHIDARQTTAGAAVIVHCGGSYWHAVASGCLFRAVGVVPVAFEWESSGTRRLGVKGNVWEGFGARYSAAGAALASDSDIELAPFKYQDLGTGTAHTVLNGYRAYSVKYTGTSPTITLPDVLFEGQELDLTVYNLSGGPVGFSLAGYGYKATQPTPSNNTGAAAKFVAMDPTASGTVSWVQVGDWATIAP